MTASTPWPVAIVGAGPVGLSLGLGLARHGVRSVVLERQDATSEHSKAPGIHVRTLEAFGHWGVAEAFRQAGTLRSTVRLNRPQAGQAPWLSVDLGRLRAEADRPGVLILEQADTERLLLDSVRADGRCEVRFGVEVVGLEQDGGGVRLRCRRGGGEEVIPARYAVGCDGASSFVREALGLPFDGLTYSLRPALADVRVEDVRDELPWPRTELGKGSVTTALQLRSGLWRLIRLDPGGAEGDGVDRAEIAAWMEEVLGPGPFEVVWASRFRIHRRAAPRFRDGRVLLAGDAAHVHSPVGGLGMNAGIGDAYNLAWKLAAALDGGDEDGLLDSYDTERRAVVVESVSRYTDVVTRLFLQSPAALRRRLISVLGWLLRIPAVEERAVRRASMVGLHYPASALLDADDRAAGRRLPNLALRTPQGGEVRLYDLLPVGPALIDVAEDRDFASGLPSEAVIPVGPGGYGDPSGVLRGLLGDLDGWILVRPDSHIAWARCERRGLEEATRRALGAGTTSRRLDAGSLN